MEAINKTCDTAGLPPFGMARAPRVLFVSDDGGERAWLASEYARRIAVFPAGFECAGFELREWDERLLMALRQEGFELPEEPPARALDLAFASTRYDLVVTVSESGRLGLGETFRKYIRALYASEADILTWEIPSLGLCAAGAEEWELEFQEVSMQLSAEVAWLLASLEEPLPGAA